MSREIASCWDYEKLKALLVEEALPAMLVDLDLFDANVRQIADVARGTGKTIRLASKSVRVPALIRRIFDMGGDVFQGLMCFSVSEAQFLATQSFDDLLIAYPTVQVSDLAKLWEMTQRGVDVTLMVDEPQHIEILEAFWRQRAEGRDQSQPLRVCIDADMSYRPMGLHLGVRRSPVRSLDSFRALLQLIQQAQHIELAGVMGYEAQIAGLGDASPFAPMLNPIKRAIKRLSTKDVARQRKAIAGLLEQEGVEIRFYNGGGTGSLDSTTAEPWLTEVTAGSGFLQSHLFDYYKNNRCQPAFCFGLRVTRIPQPGMVTCQSGGFIASGEIGPDKAPVVFLPQGLTPTQTEGFGEVQTPLQLPPGLQLQPGDPVFFRPAKAGEIAERFNEYILIQNNEIVQRVRTYRGYGECFY